MKIAFISTILNFPWGGADALWTRMAEAARARGDEVLLVLSPKTSEHARIRALCAGGATLHLRERHTTPLSGRQRLRQHIRRLAGRQTWIEQLGAFRPDVVVLCQGGTFDFLIEPQLVAHLDATATPVVVICQANSDDAVLAPAERIAATKMFDAARAIIFVSEHNLRAAERQLARAVPNARVVQNPLSRSFTPLPWPGSSRLKLAAVGRLDCSAKGYDVLVPALAKAFDGDSSWELTIFGRGPDGDYLQQLARHVGLAQRVRLNGFVDDVGTIWRDHHLLLLPSRVEGCSLAMMEAICSGRPVLATNVGGVAEWITDGHNGFLCVAPQVDALAETLQRAWAARSQWEQMGQRSAELAARLLDPAPEQKVLAACANP